MFVPDTLGHLLVLSEHLAHDTAPVRRTKRPLQRAANSSSCYQPRLPKLNPKLGPRQNFHSVRLPDVCDLKGRRSGDPNDRVPEASVTTRHVASAIAASVTPVPSRCPSPASCAPPPDFQAASPCIGIGAGILSRRSIKWRLAGPLSRDRSSSYSLPS